MNASDTRESMPSAPSTRAASTGRRSRRMSVDPLSQPRRPSPESPSAAPAPVDFAARLEHFYASVLTAAELQDLTRRASAGLEDEVELLRALVRRAAAEQDTRAIEAMMRALTAALKAQRDLATQTANRVDQALIDALEELAERELAESGSKRWSTNA